MTPSHMPHQQLLQAVQVVIPFPYVLLPHDAMLQREKEASERYAFMLERLRSETKDLDQRVATAAAELEAQAARRAAAQMALRHAQTERTRSRALVVSLASQLEATRTLRRTKRERVEATIAEQESKLREQEERDRKRLTLSLMPRVSSGLAGLHHDYRSSRGSLAGCSHSCSLAALPLPFLLLLRIYFTPSISSLRLPTSLRPAGRP